MIKLLPEVLRKENNKKLLEIADAQIKINLEYAESLEDQFIINKTTWFIDELERIYGINNSALKLEHRRELLQAKMRGRGRTTLDTIKKVAEAFSGSEVEVEEFPDKFKFIIRFVGDKGIPADIESFKANIDEIKPAHLIYELEFTFIVWGDIKDKEWETLKGFTWNDVMKNREVIE